MTVRTSEFETSSEKRARTETQRWLAQEKAELREIRYLTEVITARMVNCQASVTLETAMVGLAVALSALWGALLYTGSATGWIVELIRVLFLASGAASFWFTAVASHTSWEADRWTLLLARVKARELDLPDEAEPRGIFIRLGRK